MKKSAKAIISMSLLSLFLCSNNNAIIGVKQTELIKRANDNVSYNIDELFTEANLSSDEIINSTFDYSSYNRDKSYINCLKNGEITPLEKENDIVINILLKNYQLIDEKYKITNSFDEYSKIDEDVNNLRLIYQSKFEVELSSLAKTLDYAIEQGMVDTIRNLNGDIVYDDYFLDVVDIYNPECLNQYSIYDEVMEDYYGENEDGISLTYDPVLCTLSNLLYNSGLSKIIVEAFKATLATIKAAIKYILPWIVRLGLLVIAISSLTVIIINYWKQIEMIFDAIVDIFVSTASSFATKIKEIFVGVRSKANESNSDAKIVVDGKNVFLKALSASYVKALEKTYGNNIYFQTYLFFENDIENHIYKENVYISPTPLNIEEATAILSINEKAEFNNVYTSKRYKARKVARKPYGNCTAPEIHNTPKSYAFTAYYHFHPKLGNDRKSNHSFYGEGQSIAAIK